MSGKGGYPKFQKRKAEASFTVSETMGLEPGLLKLPKCGKVRIASPDDAQKKFRRLIRAGKARIMSVTVSRDACGDWFASLTIKRTRTVTSPAPTPTEVVGVDVGLKTRAVVHDTAGSEVLTVKGTNHSKTEAKRLRKAQRAVSRKDRVHGKNEGADGAVVGPRRNGVRKRNVKSSRFTVRYATGAPMTFTI